MSAVADAGHTIPSPPVPFSRLHKLTKSAGRRQVDSDSLEKSYLFENVLPPPPVSTYVPPLFELTIDVVCVLSVVYNGIRFLRGVYCVSKGSNCNSASSYENQLLNMIHIQMRVITVRT